jgi:energy-coupling factor transporter ATP-binding protein EcfA2
MIKLIVGKKGSGKTKLLIDNANDAIKKVKGHVVFIDYDNSHMFQIDYRVRFMSVKEYKIDSEVGFYGYLCGIIASNYDIETIFIDGLFKITQCEIKQLEKFFTDLGMLEMKYNINFVFNISCNAEELPEYLKVFNITYI